MVAMSSEWQDVAGLLQLVPELRLPKGQAHEGFWVLGLGV